MTWAIWHELLFLLQTMLFCFAAVAFIGAWHDENLSKMIGYGVLSIWLCP